MKLQLHSGSIPQTKTNQKFKQPSVVLKRQQPTELCIAVTSQGTLHQLTLEKTLPSSDILFPLTEFHPY